MNYNDYIKIVPYHLIKEINGEDLKEHISNHKTSKNMKCACLIRVSTPHQDLEQQSIKVKEQALRDGYSKENIFLIEDTESGVKLSEEERNGLNKLKKLIEENDDLNCVYVYELSRISRNVNIVYNIRDYLVKHNIQLIIMNPFFKMLKNDGTLSETSNIFFGIFAAMAENEGYLRKARIKKAVDKYRAMGLHTGGNKMFGYTTNKHHEYIVDPIQGPIVREIFNMYVKDRMSIRKISKELYERGIEMRTTENEAPRTSYLTMCCNVNNILHRPDYYGAVKGKPAIISKRLYDLAQEVMKNRIINAGRNEVKAMLKGMIYDKNNGGYLLSCNTYTKYYYSKRVKGCSISFEAADLAATTYINKHIERWTKDNNKQMLKDMAARRKKLYDKEEAAIDRKKEIKEAIERLEERIVMGKISAKLADKLENKLRDDYEEQSDLAIIYYRDRLILERQMEVTKKMIPIKIDDHTPIDLKIKTVKQMINKIYIWRESRTIAYMEIEDIYGKKEIMKIDTFHRTII